MEEAAVDDELVDLIRAQTGCLRLLALPVLRSELDRVLDSRRKRLVYEMTDGDHNVREISKATGASLGSVSAYWKDRETLGLISQVGRRFVHLASLASLGMAVEPADVTKRP
jgi:hypothetical protein